MLQKAPESLDGVQRTGVGRQEPDLEVLAINTVQLLGVVDPEIV